MRGAFLVFLFAALVSASQLYVQSATIIPGSSLLGSAVVQKATELNSESDFSGIFYGSNERVALAVPAPPLGDSELNVRISSFTEVVQEGHIVVNAGYQAGAFESVAIGQEAKRPLDLPPSQDYLLYVSNTTEGRQIYALRRPINDRKDSLKDKPDRTVFKVSGCDDEKPYLLIPGPDSFLVVCVGSGETNFTHYVRSSYSASGDGVVQLTLSEISANASMAVPVDRPGAVFPIGNGKSSGSTYGAIVITAETGLESVTEDAEFVATAITVTGDTVTFAPGVKFAYSTMARHMDFLTSTAANNGLAQLEVGAQLGSVTYATKHGMVAPSARPQWGGLTGGEPTMAVPGLRNLFFHGDKIQSFVVTGRADGEAYGVAFTLDEYKITLVQKVPKIKGDTWGPDLSPACFSLPFLPSACETVDTVLASDDSLIIVTVTTRPADLLAAMYASPELRNSTARLGVDILAFGIDLSQSRVFGVTLIETARDLINGEDQRFASQLPTASIWRLPTLQAVAPLYRSDSIVYIDGNGRGHVVEMYLHDDIPTGAMIGVSIGFAIIIIIVLWILACVFSSMLSCLRPLNPANWGCVKACVSACKRCCHKDDEEEILNENELPPAMESDYALQVVSARRECHEAAIIAASIASSEGERAKTVASARPVTVEDADATSQMVQSRIASRDNIQVEPIFGEGMDVPSITIPDIMAPVVQLPAHLSDSE